MRCPHCAGSGKVVDPTAVGLLLRDQRVAAGLSMRRLAALLGTSSGHIAGIESGARNRRGEWTRRFAAACKANKVVDNGAAGGVQP